MCNPSHVDKFALKCVKDVHFLWWYCLLEQKKTNIIYDIREFLESNDDPMSHSIFFISYEVYTSKVITCASAKCFPNQLVHSCCLWMPKYFNICQIFISFEVIFNVHVLLFV